jgi:hypothetical protein
LWRPISWNCLSWHNSRHILMSILFLDMALRLAVTRREGGSKPRICMLRTVNIVRLYSRISRIRNYWWRARQPASS